jgi:uncharacterized repeat protein (TIGR03803 family)
MMATTSKKTNRAHLRSQCSGLRRSAGIILAVLSALFLLGTGAAQRAHAQTFTVLHSFSGGTNDGAYPYAGLVMDSSGNLYGTTYVGGGGSECFGVGCGTVFKLDISGALTVLHSFSGSDGKYPYAGLVRDSSGNLYGTTLYGGSIGYGTVFKLETSGPLTVLHSCDYSDGANPYAGLVRDSSGNLYGTTVGGGPSGDGGTVFKLDTSGTLTVLHNFSGSDGAYPYAGLVIDSSGNLYGTTSQGGSYGYGTVFKLDSSGALTVLHNFSGSDGGYPQAGLVRDSSGNLYGTTTYAGGSFGYGTVFKLDTSGVLTVLHSFPSGTNDGAYPYGGLVMDSSGNLYGTTAIGGSNGYGGTVFKLDTSGALTVLHNFSGSDGAYPYAGLMMDSYGTLYGTTHGGGSSGYGTVFEIVTTPQGATQAIITQVNGLLAQGVINTGQDNPLVKVLHHAIDMMNAGKINGAIGNLESFISEVNDLENSGVLTGAQASALTSAANSVIEQLQAM